AVVSGEVSGEITVDVVQVFQKLSGDRNDQETEKKIKTFTKEVSDVSEKRIFDLTTVASNEGTYRLNTTINGVKKTTEFTVIDGRTDPRNDELVLRDPKLGVCEGGPINNLLSTYNLEMFGNLRFDAYWNVTEKSKGVYKLDADTQNALNYCKEKGVTPLVILNGDKPSFYTNPEGLRAPTTSEELEAYKKFTEFVVREVAAMGFRQADFEIWNEYVYYDGKDQNTKRYADIVKYSAPAIKAINPEYKVGIGCSVALGATPKAGYSFLHNVLKELTVANVQGSFDAVTYHAYPYQHNFDKNTEPSSVMTTEAWEKLGINFVHQSKYNQADADEERLVSLLNHFSLNDKKIWITEMSPQKHVKYPEMTEAKFMNTYVKWLLEMKSSPVVEKIYLYRQKDSYNLEQLAETSISKEVFEDYGLVRNGSDRLGALSAKPRYVVLYHLIQALNGAEPISQSTSGQAPTTETKHVYKFEKDGKEMSVDWSQDMNPFELNFIHIAGGGEPTSSSTSLSNSSTSITTVPSSSTSSSSSTTSTTKPSTSTSSSSSTTSTTKSSTSTSSSSSKTSTTKPSTSTSSSSSSTTSTTKPSTTSKNALVVKDLTLNYAGIFTPRAAVVTATDVNGRDITSSVYAQNWPNLWQNGEYTITYAVWDGSKTATAKAKVTVKATLPTAIISGVKTQVYSGMKKNVQPIVKIGSSKLKLNKDYKLSYQNNVGVGKASVQIIGINGVIGKKKISYTILPKSTKLTSVKVKKGSAQLGWKKVTTKPKVSGYTIRYRAVGTKKWKTVSLSMTSKSKTVKNLKKGKKYEFSISTKVKVAGKLYTSSWSKQDKSQKVK
ncbi:MAG: hypothetical protein LBD38_02500, partial [Streptococcaceae bacterium]|nr:hypothetical protein [Streptococcaceae bacterium]